MTLAARRGTGLRVAVVLVASLLLGGSTLLAQGALPDALASFANSASGWTLVTVLLVFWARLRPPASAGLAAGCFVLLVLGYTAAAALVGLVYRPLLFLVVGVVVGPFVGVATAWLRARSAVRAACGTALLAGIAVGEATYGLTVVAATTSPVYWGLIGVLGLALLVGMVVRRIHDAVGRVVAVAGTAAVAAAFLGAYTAL